MSSTTFSTTPISVTPANVDPHAEVEGAGPQNPVAPHDAPIEAPAPGNPPAAELVQAEARLHRMLDTALDRSGGLRGMNGTLYDAIKAEIPRPKVFHGGFRIHPSMLDAAKACDAAAASLRGIPVADFRRNPLPDAAFAALKTFVSAQNELYAQIVKFQKSSGVKAALLDSLAQATQFRASEALNFAATMQLMAMPAERQQEIAPGIAEPQGVTAGQAMQGMAHGMHGSRETAGKLRDDAAQLFGRIDALEGRKGQMPEAEFRETIAGLRADLETLRTRVGGAINPPPAPEGGHALIPDRSLFSPVEGMLARSAERLETLAAADPKAGVKSAVAAILPPVDQALLSAAAALPGGLGTLLSTGIVNYNNKVSEIMTRLDAGTLTPEQLTREMEDAAAILQTKDTRRACGTLLTMMQIAEHPTIGSAKIRNYYQHFCGEALPRGMADKLRQSVGQNGFVLVPPEMKKLAAQIENTPLLTRSKIVDSEFQEAAGMLRSTGASPQARGEYIQAALDHHVDMGTILEASLRGIPSDQLELRAGDGILTQTRKLGQGAANTVHLCTYRGKDGEDMTLVFKPEVGARRGLDHLCASGLGYRDGARIMQLNVAASRVADAIGCGGAIARSSIGSHDGQLGLFMEAAPGKTFSDIAEGKPFCRTADGRELNFTEACQTLHANGKLDVMRANLMRELSRMEWADVLSGQVDRHGGNYLVDINPETGAVKITGIDNDASFGSRKTGMTVVDLSHPTPRQQNFLAMLSRRYAIPTDGRINLSRLPENLLTETRQQFGFNQLFRPVFIDRDTFDRLTSIKEEDYRAMLAPCMDADAVNAAVDRLKEAQEYAAYLERNNHVVDDWAAPSIKESYMRNKIGVNGTFEERIRNGFFTRDFLKEFSAVL